jgi:hypothetical protein
LASSTGGAYEIVVARDQHPVLVASPAENYLVVGAGQADLGHVHRVVPGGLQMWADPVGDVLIQQELHAGRDTGRWYSRTENAA